jgi:hypothetical protein
VGNLKAVLLSHLVSYLLRVFSDIVLEYDDVVARDNALFGIN